MFSKFDFGLIDFSLLPKRIVASQIARAGATGDYESSRRTFYRLLHFGSILPPQTDQGGKMTWDRDLLEAFVNMEIVKNAEGQWVWFETGKPVPICPNFVPQHETSYRPAHNSSAILGGAR